MNYHFNPIIISELKNLNWFEMFPWFDPSFKAFFFYKKIPLRKVKEVDFANIRTTSI